MTDKEAQEAARNQRVKMFTDLESALREARRTQERFSYGVLVVERKFPVGSLYYIAPHRDESLITEGIIHYPTPKGQPFVPKIKRRKKRGVGQCPGCGQPWNGLCPACYEIKKRLILGAAGLDDGR